MKNDHATTDDLLLRFLAGETSDEDVRLVDCLLREDSSAAARLAEFSVQDSLLSHMAGEQQVSAPRRRKAPAKNRLFLRYGLPCAAAAAVGGGIVAVCFDDLHRNAETHQRPPHLR